MRGNKQVTCAVRPRWSPPHGWAGRPPPHAPSPLPHRHHPNTTPTPPQPSRPRHRLRAAVRRGSRRPPAVHGRRGAGCSRRRRRAQAGRLQRQGTAGEGGSEGQGVDSEVASRGTLEESWNRKRVCGRYRACEEQALCADVPRQRHPPRPTAAYRGTPMGHTHGAHRMRTRWRRWQCVYMGISLRKSGCGVLQTPCMQQPPTQLTFPPPPRDSSLGRGDVTYSPPEPSPSLCCMGFR